MSLQPLIVQRVPEETARVARAAFPKGNPYLRLFDQLGPLYADQQFAALFPSLGQPGISPAQLALVTVLQFAENLSDRQAAEAVRSRIDWKYLLGLELTDAGFDYSTLSEFRDRLVEGAAEGLLLTTLLALSTSAGVLKARGRQRTDSTHVHVFGLSAVLQFGSPSVARIIARAPSAARTPRRNLAETSMASAVGVPPFGRFPRISARSWLAWPVVGVRSGAPGELHDCELPEAGKRSAPIPIVVSTGGNVDASALVRISHRVRPPVVPSWFPIDPERSSRNITAGVAFVRFTVPGVHPTGASASASAAASPPSASGPPSGPSDVLSDGRSRPVRAPQLTSAAIPAIHAALLREVGTGRS